MRVGVGVSVSLSTILSSCVVRDRYVSCVGMRGPVCRSGVASSRRLGFFGALSGVGARGPLARARPARARSPLAHTRQPPRFPHMHVAPVQL